MLNITAYPYLVGSGSSSLVYRTSHEQVVKCGRPGTLDEIEREHDILERLGQHPLIIRSFGWKATGELILEYHPRELRAVLISGTHIHPEKWALQITEALAHVHANNIIHRDFNSRNIRIKASEDIVLCDFAGSSSVGHGQTGVRGEVRFCRLPYNSMATIQDDLFALGSVLYELSTRSVPYATLKDEEVIRLYSDRKFPLVGDLLMGETITNCWNGTYQSTNEVLLDLKKLIHSDYNTRRRYGFLFLLTGPVFCIILMDVNTAVARDDIGYIQNNLLYFVGFSQASFNERFSQREKDWLDTFLEVLCRESTADAIVSVVGRRPLSHTPEWKGNRIFSASENHTDHLPVRYKPSSRNYQVFRQARQQMEIVLMLLGVPRAQCFRDTSDLEHTQMVLLSSTTTVTGQDFLVLLRVTAVIALVNLYRSRQAAAMMTIPSDGGLSEASRAVRARASRADGQTWTSRAYWHTRGQVLGFGSAASSRVGLGPQYVRGGTWSVQEEIRPPPAYRRLSLGTAFTATGDSGSDTLGGTS